MPAGCGVLASAMLFFYFFSFIHLFLEQNQTTHILVFLNIHFGILTWNMGYMLCLFTIFAWWPQIVNLISPNYAQSSVLVQIKCIGSLAVWLRWAYFLCFYVSFSLLTFSRPILPSLHSGLCLSALVFYLIYLTIACHVVSLWRFLKL